LVWQRSGEYHHRRGSSLEEIMDSQCATCNDHVAVFVLYECLNCAVLALD
jgi:hypothetical protein